MYTVVLQAYGRERIVQEARFAIASVQHWALHQPAPYRIVVYTDQPERFADLGPHLLTEPMDAARLAAWRGAVDFVHRVKLEVLLDCLARHPGTLFYLDSDTYCERDPFPLLAQVDGHTALMHLREGRLSERKNGIFRKMHRFVTRTPLPLPDGTVVRISPDAEMWNAGVIGLDARVAVPLLRQALALTDAMHSRYRKHVTEQLAMSWVLQTSLRILPAEEVVHHYWQSCAELEPVLGDFFARHARADIATVGAAAVALAPRGTPPAPRRPWWARLLGR